MAHTYARIWIHATWATKKRRPLIIPSIEETLYRFISEEFSNQRCPCSIVNGTADHLHCLFLLNSGKSAASVIKQGKGSSSRFINRENLIQQGFLWQTGYCAFSVSEGFFNSVYKYILNQKNHHRTPA